MPETGIETNLQVGLESILTDADLEFMKGVSKESENVIKGLLATTRHAEAMHVNLKNMPSGHVSLICISLIMLLGRMKFEELSILSTIVGSIIKGAGIDEQIKRD